MGGGIFVNAQPIGLAQRSPRTEARGAAGPDGRAGQISSGRYFGRIGDRHQLVSQVWLGHSLGKPGRHGFRHVILGRQWPRKKFLGQTAERRKRCHDGHRALRNRSTDLTLLRGARHASVCPRPAALSKLPARNPIEKNANATLAIRMPAHMKSCPCIAPRGHER